MQVYYASAQGRRRSRQMAVGFGVLLVILACISFGTIAVELLPEGGSPPIDLFFVPESEFSTYIPEYEPTHDGYYSIYWDGEGEIMTARILVSTTGISQKRRSHIIWKEVIQSIGLMNSSYRHPDSIFYGGYSEVVELTEIDRTLIEMLYRVDVWPGMSPGVMRILLENEYASEELGYFEEIAFHSEPESGPVLHKWKKSPTIRVHGSPTEADLEALNEAVAVLNELMGEVRLRVEAKE